MSTAHLGSGLVRAMRDEFLLYADDPEFSTIRRKLARWAADNVRIIKDLKPPQPKVSNSQDYLPTSPLGGIANEIGETAVSLESEFGHFADCRPACPIWYCHHRGLGHSRRLSGRRLSQGV